MTDLQILHEKINFNALFHPNFYKIFTNFLLSKHLSTKQNLSSQIFENYSFKKIHDRPV